MAINVNTVYTTVLSILNKEQRGYLTPDEFNKVATQAQLNIFENYFEDLNQQLRIPQTNFDYSNRRVNLDDNLSTFKCLGTCNYTSDYFALPLHDLFSNLPITYNEDDSLGQLPFYRIGTITYEPSTSKPVEIQRLERNSFYNLNRSDLTAPSENYPVYLYENGQIRIFPTTIQTNVKTSFIRKPQNILWGYTVGPLGQYIYSSTPYIPGVIINNAQNEFEISPNFTGVLFTQTTTPTTYTVSQSAGPPVSGDSTFQTNSFSGTGAVFTMTVTGTGTSFPLTSSNTTFTIQSGGVNYQPGDVFTIATGAFGAGPIQNPIRIILSTININPLTLANSVDFQINNSQQTEVILEILKLSGVIIRDPQIVQAAVQELAEDENNSKR
tara:strand:- start:465 stop:1613 length:1149 start_codon:yes stop_codon:yes gene_type:complete